MTNLIILTGPTAVGKTELSIKLAKLINGEIISADSMQVYKGMDIGTAKVKLEEMDGVTHHLIDIITPFADWNVSLFANKAKECIEDIVNRGKIPIVAGGTGFYIQALLKDVDFVEEETSEIRLKLEKELEENGIEKLYEKLKEVDIKSTEKIHINNHKRVIRALEFYYLHGYPISQHNEIESTKISPYNFIYFVLNMSRETLYERINKRIDLMLDEGLVEEVSGLVKSGLDKSYVSMQGLGYKEIIDYLNGDISLEEAIYILKRDTRHFAKRQLTWFRREEDVIMVDKDSFNGNDEILKFMLEKLKEKSIYEG